MSILLDALRKSENQKHLGHVPTIHSTAGLSARPRRNWKPGPLLLVLLPALMVIGWYGMQRLTTGAGPESVRANPPAKGPVTSNAEERIVADERVVDEDRADHMDIEGPDAETQKAITRSALPSIPQSPGKSRPAVADRTAVESYSGPEIAEPANYPPGSEGTVQRTTASVASETAEAENLAQAIESLERRVENAGELSAATDAGSRSNAAPASDSYRTPRYEEISYWGLPESVRVELPAPRITVLVYADRPEDRFLLLDGKRLAEGERTDTGMVLEEIRRDGAVFSYRMYRFLVPR